MEKLLMQELERKPFSDEIHRGIFSARAKYTREILYNQGLKIVFSKIWVNDFSPRYNE